jgi:hypothetical protein
MRDPPTCVLILIFVYLIGYLGLWRSLALFPWEKETQNRPGGNPWQLEQQKPELVQDPVTWPYHRLGPQVANTRVFSTGDALLAPLFIGWVLYCVCWIPGQARQAGDMAMLFGLGLITLFSAARLAIYLHGYGPPISLWGRVARGTWIIPGYDKVFLGPLFGMLVGFGSAFLLEIGGLPRDIAFPIAVSLAALFVFNFPPTRKSWFLTGHHRIVGGTRNARDYLEVG